MFRVGVVLWLWAVQQCAHALTFASMSVGYSDDLSIFDEQRIEDSVHDFVLRNIDNHPSKVGDVTAEYRSVVDKVCVILSNDKNIQSTGMFKKCSVDRTPSHILTTVDFSELKQNLFVNMRRGYTVDFYTNLLCLQLDCVANPVLQSYITHKMINALGASLTEGYNYNIRIGPVRYGTIIDYVVREKLSRKHDGGRSFTVVDVGGSFVGWSKDIVDAIADINTPPVGEYPAHIQFFPVDITHPDGWRRILEHVERHGKFDFAICSHTLEDIVNPAFVGEQLSAIAHGGFVATPSKYAELSRVVDSAEGETSYRGYIHHRYIFTMHNGHMIGYPKISYIEHVPAFDALGQFPAGRLELSFFWREKLEVSYINNNFLGPDVAAVIAMYNTLAATDDCDDIVSKLVLYNYSIEAGEPVLHGRLMI